MNTSGVRKPSRSLRGNGLEFRYIPVHDSHYLPRLLGSVRLQRSFAAAQGSRSAARACTRQGGGDGRRHPFAASRIVFDGEKRRIQSDRRHSETGGILLENGEPVEFGEPLFVIG